MFRKFTKKRSITALSIIAVLALAGGAYAYFTASGTGNGSATVGSTTSFSVATQSASGPLYPGGASVTIPFTVTNAGQGSENIASIAASVTSGGNTGCQSAWFTATPANATPAKDLAPGATWTSSVTLQMIDSGTDQSVCEGGTPTISVTAS